MSAVERVCEALLYGRPDSGWLEDAQEQAPQVRARIREWRFDGYRDWGIAPPDPDDGRLFPARPPKRLSHGWYRSGSRGPGPAEIERRVGAVDAAGLRRIVARWLERRYRHRGISAMVLYGSYLFGPESIAPLDLDLVVEITGSGVAESNLTVADDDLADVLPSDRRIASNTIGLSVVARDELVGLCENEELLDIACETHGGGAPLVGGPLGRTPALAAVAYKPVRLIAWGYKHLLYPERRFAATSLLRLSEANAVVELLAEELELEPPAIACDTDILTRMLDLERGIDDWADFFVAESRRTARSLCAVHERLRGDALTRLEEALA